MILAFQPTMPIMIQENYKRSAETVTTNSGIDLYYPGETKLCNEQIFVDFQLKAVLLHDTPKPFYLYPRSSISKTPFRLANSVGIIDQDYRGNLGAYLDVIHPDATLYHGVRLCQLCATSLEPCRNTAHGIIHGMVWKYFKRRTRIWFYGCIKNVETTLRGSVLL